MRFDFAVGANQGQGVPAVPGSEGLAVELVYGWKVIGIGEQWDGEVPKGNDAFNQLVDFGGDLEEFGDDRLVAVIAGVLVSSIFKPLNTSER